MMQNNIYFMTSLPGYTEHVYVADNALAKSSHARILPRPEQLPLTAWGHVS